MKRALYVAAAAAALGSTGVQAAENAVYGGFGTTGFVLGYSRAFSDQFGGRIEADAFHYSRSFDTDNANYDGKLDFKAAGAFADYYPWRNNWRLSAGLFAGDNNAEGHGTPKNTTYTSNGVSYTLDGQRLDFKAELPSVRPYLGFGYGSPHRPNGGLGFFADVGVTYGRPDVTLTSTVPLPTPDAQARLDDERNELQDKADKLTWFPVVRLGLSYGF